MHPAIRIVNCLLLIVMLASGLPLAFFVALFITLVLLLLCYYSRCFPRIMPVWRLRWLFVSILVLYLLFPPVIVAGWQEQLMASLEEAAMRIVALIAIVLLVQMLFSATERQNVLAGLLWLLWPLSRLRLPVKRFALRLMLVMEIVPRAQDLLRQHHASDNTSNNRVKRLVNALASVYARVLEEAGRTPLYVMDVPVLQSPAAHEWLSPCILISLMAGITIAL